MPRDVGYCLAWFQNWEEFYNATPGLPRLRIHNTSLEVEPNESGGRTLRFRRGTGNETYAVATYAGQLHFVRISDPKILEDFIFLGLPEIRLFEFDRL
jgi:hypothetical protein